MLTGAPTKGASAPAKVQALPSPPAAWPDETRLALVCLAYTFSACLYAPQQYYSFLSIYVQAAVVTVLPSVGLVVLGAALSKGRAAPLGYLKEKFADQFLYAGATVGIFILSISAFTTWKYNIPALVPFYADTFFADLDRSLFGADAWRILHDLLPEWSILLIQPLYSAVWFSLWFGVVGYVALRLNGPVRQRYLWALAATIVTVGTILATLLSSVGPVFYDQFIGGTRFSDLRVALASTSAGSDTIRYADYLSESYRSGESTFGSGISAMPSMHVAIAFLNALFFTSHGRRIAAAFWAFAVVIAVSSVYTGWHYAVDGCVSVVAVAIIWFAVSRALGLPLAGRIPAVAAGRPSSGKPDRGRSGVSTRRR